MIDYPPECSYWKWDISMYFSFHMGILLLQILHSCVCPLQCVHTAWSSVGPWSLLGRLSMKIKEIINAEPFHYPLFIMCQSFRLRAGEKKKRKKRRQIYLISLPWVTIAQVSLASSIFTWISHAILVIISHTSLTCSINAQKDRAVLAHVEFLHSLRIYCVWATDITPELEDNTKGVSVADFCSSPW